MLERDNNEANKYIHHEESYDDDEDDIEYGHPLSRVVHRPVAGPE